MPDPTVPHPTDGATDREFLLQSSARWRAIARDRGAEVERLQAEVEMLRNEVRQLGRASDTCTFSVLDEVCGGCQCGRRA